MDDRAVGILDNYEIQVLKTYKGRGAILCETTEGLRILKEYFAPEGKAAMLEKLLREIGEDGKVCVDEYIRNKQGELLSHDRDGKAYVVKKYFHGRECVPNDENDLEASVRSLALIHGKMILSEEYRSIMHMYRPEQEMLRHNRELRRVRNYVKNRRSKTDFELLLMHYYDIFENKALNVVKELEKEDFSQFYEEVNSRGTLVHGDFQYHNVMFVGNLPAIINFEHVKWDSRVRDLSVFLRKTLEKSEWSVTLGEQLIHEYEEVLPLSHSEKLQLYYRLAYPEKFWKIINSYYNSGKAFVSLQYIGKLEMLMSQEQSREKFLEYLLGKTVQ